MAENTTGQYPEEMIPTRAAAEEEITTEEAKLRRKLLGTAMGDMLNGFNNLPTEKQIEILSDVTGQ